MLLSGHEIESRQLIADPHHGELRSSSYDVKVGRVIGPDGKEHAPPYSLEPQKMVVVVSTDKVQLTDDVVGYASPKTSLHNEGVLALSTGILDPGYEGYISSMLINFGRESYKLTDNSSFLRLTFHEIMKPDEDTEAGQAYAQAVQGFRNEYNSNFTNYLSSRKDLAKKLPETFLDLPRHISDIAREVFPLQLTRLGNLLGGAALGLAFLTLVFAAVTFLGAPWAADLQADHIREDVLNEINAGNVGSIDSLEQDVEQLEDEVNALQESQLQDTRGTAPATDQPGSRGS